MNPIAVILNTNQLGGAERSLIEQLSLLNDQKFTFFIPELELPSNELLHFLDSKGFQSIEFFSYPGFIYKISRRKFHLLPFVFLLAPFILIYLYSWNSKFRIYNRFYVNGNKAIFPVLAWISVYRKEIQLYWHFRDFPSPAAFKIIKKLISFFVPEETKKKMKLIANSFAVQNDLRNYFPEEDIHCLYNLPGELEWKSSNEVVNIGIASMFAPWKGLHSVLLMIGLYEKELTELGIKSFTFYGDEIYQTSGDHNQYSTQLHNLSQKFRIRLVKWGGKKSPKEIFAGIDVLIHPSILPEPFGRVIIEAFKSGVPVISTGLGGASELIQEGVTGLRWELYNYDGLFNLLKTLKQNPQLVASIKSNALLKSKEIESELHSKVRSLFA